MNKNQSEGKRMQFLDMQEHPEKYTDRQIEALLADEEIRAFAQELAMTKRAMMRNEAGEVNVEEEWEHFSAQHSVSQQSSRMKIAASIPTMFSWSCTIAFHQYSRRFFLSSTPFCA